MSGINQIIGFEQIFFSNLGIPELQGLHWQKLSVIQQGYIVLIKSILFPLKILLNHISSPVFCIPIELKGIDLQLSTQWGGFRNAPH